MENCRKLVAGPGFEPRFTASKAGVLPLDDPAKSVLLDFTLMVTYPTTVKRFDLASERCYSVSMKNGAQKQAINREHLILAVTIIVAVAAVIVALFATGTINIPLG